MPRYPFMTQVNKFMEKRKGQCAKSSWDVDYRRYRRIDKDMKMLYTEGYEGQKISTLSPSKMTIEDFRIYLTYRLSLGYTSGEYLHDQYAWLNLCKSRFVKNTAFEECLIEYPLLKAKKYHKRLPPLDDGLYDRLVKLSNEVTGFKAVRGCALVMLVVTSGSRLNEVRTAKISDLNLDTWVFKIINVKGNMTYGEPREVRINPDARPVLRKYVTHINMLKETGHFSQGNDALFPSPDSADGFLSGNSLRRIKDDVADLLGEPFNFQILRRTFGQIAIDRGVSIESVSVLMGHSSTKTTEANYCRKRLSDANKELGGSF